MTITRGRLIAPTLFALTGFLVVSADTTVGAMAQKEKKDKDKKDKDWKDGKGAKGDKAGKDLRKAYDAITDVSQSPQLGGAASRVYDHTLRLYREAVKAYSEDPRRAAALAAAAHDAARGLRDVRHALAKPVPGLPEPPADVGGQGGPKGKGPPDWNAGVGVEPGPWSEALGELSRARERLVSGPDGFGPPPGKKDFGPPPKGPAGGPDGFGPPPGKKDFGPPPKGPAGDPDGFGPPPGKKDFGPPPKGPAGGNESGFAAMGPARDLFDAAKAIYGQARSAYEAGEYRKAACLARAAQSWSRVPEHLREAGDLTNQPPLPHPKQKGAPPPPPAIKG